jgi:hypothetical protein
MKAVTEFASFTLANGLKAKTTLATEGKTPEEIQAKLGETFKYEGEKLNHFINAIDVAGQNQDKLKRVMVVSLAEGETIPSKSTKVGEHHYVPEFQQAAYVKPEAPKGKGGRGGPGGKGGGGPKGSPWGLSPEEKAAKNKKQAPTT